MSGFVEIKAAEINAAKFTFAMIARRSVMRSGTRYFSRGIDLNGNVSNFAETEQIIVTAGKTYAHVQIRGSVPLFWRQVINVKYQPRLEVDSHPSTVKFIFYIAYCVEGCDEEAL
jgi:hypothetical protein